MLQQFQQLLQDPKITIDFIENLPASGGDRKYYRLHTQHQNLIATVSNNIAENKTFIAFTQTFAKLGLPVPTIVAQNHDCTIYIQTDAGVHTLLDTLLQDNNSTEVKELYKKSLAQLAKMQILATATIDYNLCLVSKQFDAKAVLADLQYCKYYFIDILKINYNKALLQQEFEALSQSIASIDAHYFMYRDFQSRNIMVQNQNITFIDYQGGMQGPLQYDVASLLWQAKAQLPSAWKQELLQYYIQEANAYLPQKINEKTFVENYYHIVLVRLLQVLGAYGLRGLIEQKQHFLSSIPLGINNLKEYLLLQDISQTYPTLYNVINQLIESQMPSTLSATTPTITATANSPLLITIQSFSYKKEIPKDPTSNGGGFVFDCRGILNPGRIDEYKKQTGRDQAVKTYLETQTLMPKFLQHVFGIIDISVEDYLQRNFSNLMISFGCTGGQHRSVYATDATAQYLQQKYKVKVEVNHLVQDTKNWVNV